MKHFIYTNFTNGGNVTSPPPPPGGGSSSAKIIFLGDSGMPPLADTENTANKIKQEAPDYVIHLGDANYESPQKLNTNFLNFWQNYLNKMYFVFGNHDLDYDYGAGIIENLPLVKNNLTQQKINSKFLCYDFKINNIHFFAFNSGNTYSGDSLTQQNDQFLNLENQFEEMLPKIRNSQYKWKIVLVHKPPYTNEYTHKPGAGPLRLDYKAEGVDIVMSAHSHLYEKININNIFYLIQGLGGAEKRCGSTPYLNGTNLNYCLKNAYTILNVSNNNLEFITKNIDGEIIDQFGLTKFLS
jgi:predicted phosphodiesterase